MGNGTAQTQRDRRTYAAWHQSQQKRNRWEHQSWAITGYCVVTSRVLSWLHGDSHGTQVSVPVSPVVAAQYWRDRA
jgi:hypothetical protein